MSIDSVFVYADGQIGLTLPVDIEPGNWRRAIRPCPWVSVFRDPPVERITAETEEFYRRGHMFDGRPIYCATGYDVKEAYLSRIITREAVASVDIDIDKIQREEMDIFVCYEYPDAITLDQWEGNEPLSLFEQGLYVDAMSTGKRIIRRLVAVRV